MTGLRHLSRYVTGVSGAALLVTSSATAQVDPSADSGGVTIEEIVVTARKREETLQDVPISIDARTQAELRRVGATNLEQIAQNIAGFSVQNLGPGQSQVAIRGVSAGQIVRDQPGVKEQVGIYLDESVISLSLFTPDLELVDINRVEVLRGPQGTLFGSGSLSGTVRYITNKPNTERLEYAAEASGTAIDSGGFGGSVNGALNVPVSDRFAIRGVAYFTQFGGFIDAVQPDGSINDDVNDGNRFGARLSAVFEPTETVSITPRLLYQEVNVDGFPREDEFNVLANPFTTTRPPVTLGDRQQFTQFEEAFTDEFLLADLVIKAALGPVDLTSVTSYIDRNVLQIRDSTQLTGSITGGSLGLPEDVFTLDAPLADETDLEIITQEARAAYSSDRFEAVLGVFYTDIQRNYGQTLNVAGFEAATGIPTEGVANPQDVLFFSRIPYDLSQVAVFGEGTYSLTSRLDVTAGIRWFRFNEERTLTFDGIFADQTIGLPGEVTSNGVSPRVIVSYDVTEQVTVNAQAARGFRLGGINDPLNVPLCSPQDLETFGGNETFDDETLWNYEAGLKSRLFGDRVTFNAAVFYADINDLQATLDAGTCSSRIVFNVPDARSLGTEFELAAQPIDRLRVNITGSFIDSELQSTVTSVAADGTETPLPGIRSGNRLPTVPRLQFSANATYFHPLTERWEAFATGSFQHVGSRFTQLADQAPGAGTVDLLANPVGDPSQATFMFDPELPAYQIGNLRLGARSDRYELAFFINNITDTRAKLSLDRERGGQARVGFQTNQPRTFGITLRTSY